jgi:hypothetical protein
LSSPFAHTVGEDGRVRLPVRLFQRQRHVGCRCFANDPLQHLDRHFAGDFSVLIPTHAIGHSQQEAGFTPGQLRREDRILIRLAASGVGITGDIHLKFVDNRAQGPSPGFHPNRIVSHRIIPAQARILHSGQRRTNALAGSSTIL